MKKIVWGLFVLVSVCGAGILHPQVAHAAATVPVYFEGVVTEKGQPVTDTKLIVVRCVSNGVEWFADYGYTNNKGFYTIHTNSEKCPLGSFARILNIIDTASNYDSSVMVKVSEHTTANMQIGITYTIPEYSTLGGWVALLGGAVTIAAVRYRMTNI